MQPPTQNTPGSEDDEWHSTQEMMRAAGDRLLLAGWASRVLATPEGVVVEYNGTGIDGMDNLFLALRDLTPHTMQAEHIVGLFLLLTLRDEKNSPGSTE